VRYAAVLDGTALCTPELVRRVIEEESQAIRAELGSSEAYADGEYLDAAFLTKLMCVGRELHDFLTLPAQVGAGGSSGGGMVGGVVASVCGAVCGGVGQLGGGCRPAAESELCFVCINYSRAGKRRGRSSSTVHYLCPSSPLSVAAGHCHCDGQVAEAHRRPWRHISPPCSRQPLRCLPACQPVP
jgi:hypothetical protein